MTVWFTSDTHFDHKNIIKFSNRPFNDVHHMNEMMIKYWNDLVDINDPVYHLGDFSFCHKVDHWKYLVGRLNGRIHLIRGNHDKYQLMRKLPDDLFVWVKDYFELKVQDPEAKGGSRLIVLSHYAFRVWNKSHHGSYHLYGHSHGSLPDDPNSRSFDIGVDCHNYRPISYKEVKTIMDKKNFKAIDHHGKK